MQSAVVNESTNPAQSETGTISAAERARFGVGPGWSFAIRHRVRWSECDPFGHANHRAYFEWFEEARNRYLEIVGLAPLSPNTPGPVIAETSIRYDRPLAYADEILVGARTVRLGRTSFDMEYAVWHQGLCAVGRAVLILVVNATGEKTPLPRELRERMLACDPAAGENAREKGASR
jgi:acyl-CoA thioester hydrolase